MPNQGRITRCRLLRCTLERRVDWNRKGCAGSWRMSWYWTRCLHHAPHTYSWGPTRLFGCLQSLYGAPYSVHSPHPSSNEDVHRTNYPRIDILGDPDTTPFYAQPFISDWIYTRCGRSLASLHGEYSDSRMVLRDDSSWMLTYPNYCRRLVTSPICIGIRMGLRLDDTAAHKHYSHCRSLGSY